MRASKTVVRLSWLIVVLACIASAGGLFIRNGGGQFELRTVRGTTAEISGAGLYRHDSVFTSEGFRGQDAAMLFIGLPFLLVSLLLYRRNSLRGGFLLLGALAYVLYVYASMATAAAYNVFFLVYVALLSSCLYAFTLLYASLSSAGIPGETDVPLPKRGPAALMLSGGFVTLVVWTMPIVMNLTTGAPVPYLDHYTTTVTFALDLAVITPSAFVAGVLVLKGNRHGYLIATALLGIIVMLFPVILLSTYFQIMAGITFTPGEAIGPIAGFAVLGLFGVLVYASIVRKLGTKS